MIKRIFSIIFIIFTVLSNGLVALLYSENLYSIDLPDTFSEQKSNQFVDKDGNTLIIHVSARKNEIESIDNFDDSISSMFPSTESVESEFGGVDKYETTTFTKNDYECLHVKLSAVFNDALKHVDMYKTYTS